MLGRQPWGFLDSYRRKNLIIGICDHICTIVQETVIINL